MAEITFGKNGINDAENCMLVGIVLIINGALNLWIAVTATRAARDYRRRTETVDTEFVENEGDRDETDGI